MTVREKEKGSGVWWVYIYHQGRRKSKKVGPKRLAIQVAEKINARLILSEYEIDDKKSPSPTFKAYARLWLEDYIKAIRRESTYERYHGILKKYVEPALGNVPIDQLSRGQIRKFLLRLHKSGLSKSTVSIAKDAISGVLGYAVDEELIDANPTIGITKRLNLTRRHKADPRPLAPQEVARFLETCRKHYPEHYPFFLCAFRTGMRLGELLALQWGDIDWQGKFILVRRSFKNGRMSPTKTGKIRRVDMSDRLVQALRDLYTRRKREALELGRGEVVEVVYHHKTQPWAQNSARNVFKRVLRKAGLRDMRFHDIRHTFASLLLSNGQSPVYVKEQLGHSSIR